MANSAFSKFNCSPHTAEGLIYEREINGRPLCMRNIFEQSRKGLLYQRDLRAHTGCVNAVDFSPTEEWIVSGGDDLRVRLWRTADCCTSEKPAENSVVMKAIHHSNIFSLRFSHHTERIYSAGNDHRMHVHDIKTRERLRSYRASSTIYYIATHPSDDNVIAAASEDQNVYLFDLRGNEGDGLCTKLRQEGTAFCAVWNPQNHNIVAVCNKKTGLLVYDLRMSNNTYAEAGKITKSAICADWSPSGELLFCAISRSNPICFNLQNSEHLRLSDPKYSNICTIKSCSFAGDQYLVTGSDDWNIYVWKVPSNWDDFANGTVNVHSVLEGHRSIVNHVKYGPRSNLLLSCGVEKIIKCWSGLPLRDSYQNPKKRERISTILPDFLGDPDHGSMDSDTEEDLDTLQRFDFYYEQTLRSNRAFVSDLSSEEDDELANFVVHSVESEEDANDHESFFSEITSGLYSPSPMHSPDSQSDDN
ncbi:hypothetical protein niasHS_011038 [Heterodera schachtii]|uniref:Uncharacterized protein n=1 Tax=Heterodera schachtii TaxID=97005 RepID=A0ABD2IVG0_HETSC